MNHTLTKLLSSGSAVVAALLVSSAAHAAPSWHQQTTLADAGKWAKAWSDVSTLNCAGGPAFPICQSVNASVTGRVLNAQIDAVGADAQVRRWNNHGPWVWDWNYSMRLFGRTLVSGAGSAMEMDMVANGMVGQPAITEDAPFAQSSSLTVTIDTGEINGLAGFFLGDEDITVHYTVRGGLTAQVDLMPITPYGPLASATVQPRASMVANSGLTLTSPLLDAYVGTDGRNVQVVAPSSDIKFNASMVFATGNTTITMTPNIALLKGQIIWWAHPWILANSSGDVWNQTTRYFKYMRSDVPTTLFSGTLL